MFKQAIQVLSTARARHYWKALRSPVRTVSAFKYHYRRVSEREFVEFLAGQWNIEPAAVEAAYEDLQRHESLWSQLRGHLKACPGGYAMQMTQEPPCLYLLVRLIRPHYLLETGVASGLSSAYMLRALQDNDHGHLYSVDLPPDDLPAGRESGWIVPQDLRKRWSVVIGDSREKLGPLLSKLDTVDLFLHDSLHTYDHMLWEFRTVWPCLRPGGLFLSHDVGANEAFAHFMKEERIPWSGYRVYHVLGGFRKP